MSNVLKLVKWPGSKATLVPELIARVPPKWYASPDRSRHYVEPFAGSAALFFALRAQGWNGPAHVSDTNEDLMTLYAEVKDRTAAVASAYHGLIEGHKASEDPERFYYEVRDGKAWIDPRLDATRRAARFLWLNRNGFNGLVRYNREGRFNVPWGKRDPAASEVMSAEAIHAVAVAMQGANLACSPFDKALKDVVTSAAVSRTLVYLDPPFLAPDTKPDSGRHAAGSNAAGFTAYTAGGFGHEDHVRLARWARELALRGASVMLSAADCGPSWAVYGGLRDGGLFTIDVVQARRSISRDGGGRGSVGELIAYTRGWEP